MAERQSHHILPKKKQRQSHQKPYPYRLKAIRFVFSQEDYLNSNWRDRQMNTDDQSIANSSENYNHQNQCISKVAYFASKALTFPNQLVLFHFGIKTDTNEKEEREPNALLS